MYPPIWKDEFPTYKPPVEGVLRARIRRAPRVGINRCPPPIAIEPKHRYSGLEAPSAYPTRQRQQVLFATVRGEPATSRTRPRTTCSARTVLVTARAVMVQGRCGRTRTGHGGQLCRFRTCQRHRPVQYASAPRSEHARCANARGLEPSACGRDETGVRGAQVTTGCIPEEPGDPARWKVYPTAHLLKKRWNTAAAERPTWPIYKSTP